MGTQSLEEEIVLFLRVVLTNFTWWSLLGGNWVQGGKKLNIKILEAKWGDGKHVHPQLLTSIQVARILECSNYNTTMYTWGGSFLPSFHLVHPTHLFVFLVSLTLYESKHREWRESRAAPPPPLKREKEPNKMSSQSRKIWKKANRDAAKICMDCYGCFDCHMDGSSIPKIRRNGAINLWHVVVDVIVVKHQSPKAKKKKYGTRKWWGQQETKTQTHTHTYAHICTTHHNMEWITQEK